MVAAARMWITGLGRKESQRGGTLFMDTVTRCPYRRGGGGGHSSPAETAKDRRKGRRKEREREGEMGALCLR